MRMLKSSNVEENEDFQRLFNGFYRVRQRPKEFYNALYYYLENNKLKEASFKQTIEFFFQEFHRLEPSFSSKIVATINPDLPVWDSIVLKRLNMKAPGYNLEKETRLKYMIVMYDEIINWYSKILQTDEAKKVIYAFEQHIGPKEITDVKKIDLILWQTRP